MLTSNKTGNPSETPTCLSVLNPDSKTDHMQSRPLHIESVERDIPYAGDTGYSLHVYGKCMKLI
jgi:hypothetical protein